jgi:hypothetical protein
MAVMGRRYYIFWSAEGKQLSIPLRRVVHQPTSGGKGMQSTEKYLRVKDKGACKIISLAPGQTFNKLHKTSKHSTQALNYGGSGEEI